MNTVPQATNDQQRQLVKKFLQNSLPFGSDTIFSNAEFAGDYCHAYLVAFYKATVTTWIEKNILSRIRNQALTMSPEELKSFVAVNANRFAKKEVDFNVLIVPFSSGSNNIDRAVQLWQKIFGLIVTEDILSNEDNPLIMLLPVLIAGGETSRTWPLLFEGVKNGRVDAIRVFHQMVAFFNFFGASVVFKSDTSPDLQWMKDPTKLLYLIEHLLPREPQSLHMPEVVLPVPLQCVFSATNTLKRLLEKKRQAMEDFLDLIAWFGAREQEFQDHAQHMWQQIQTKARCGLNPGGRDVVVVEVLPLREIGLRWVQLIPEETFPEATVRLWTMVQEIDLRFMVEHHLQPSVPLTAINSPVDDGPDMIGLTDKLHQYIALHAYWKIVMKEPMQRRPGRTTKSQREEQVRLKQAFLKRPHFRWLLPGSAMSDRARDRSQSYFGYRPPEGKTFVQSNSEGVIPTQTDPSTVVPVYRYTNADLGYGVAEV